MTYLDASLRINRGKTYIAVLRKIDSLQMGRSLAAAINYTCVTIRSEAVYEAMQHDLIDIKDRAL